MVQWQVIVATGSVTLLATLVGQSLTGFLINRYTFGNQRKAVRSDRAIKSFDELLSALNDLRVMYYQLSNAPDTIIVSRIVGLASSSPGTDLPSDSAVAAQLKLAEGQAIRARTPNRNLLLGHIATYVATGEMFAGRDKDTGSDKERVAYLLLVAEIEKLMDSVDT